MSAAKRQIVVLPNGAPGRRGHDFATHVALAQRLAELLDSRVVDTYEPGHGGYPYYVPQETLLYADARALGVRNEHDLFGGVVPNTFVATKTITHKLVDMQAQAPHGWSHILADHLFGVVLPGYTAFTRADAQRAGRLLLRNARVRIKPGSGLGGAGQCVAANESELDAAIAALDGDELHTHGIVMEENIEEPVIMSIGEVRVANLRCAYHGEQHPTRNNRGHEVYGGSALHIVRGGLTDLLALELQPDVRWAVEQALAYDRAVSVSYPRFFASRRNYDVAQGHDRRGRRLSGVLEQSWRIGGASPAEIAALRAFAADANLHALRAETHEVYSPQAAPPPTADVYFDGDDPDVGRLLKYCVVHINGRAA